MFDFDQFEPHFNDAARVLQKLSNPARLRLLCVLIEGEATVGALVSATGMAQPTVSQHLRQLRDCGLVESRREGQTVINRLKGSAAHEIMRVLNKLYCAPVADVA